MSAPWEEQGGRATTLHAAAHTTTCDMRTITVTSDSDPRAISRRRPLARRMKVHCMLPREHPTFIGSHKEEAARQRIKV